MKVLIGSSCFPGEGRGISTYVYDIIEMFSQKGDEVYLTCPSSKSATKFENFFLTDQYQNPLSCAKGLCDYIIENNIELIINNDNPILQSVIPLLGIRAFSIGHMNNTSVATLAVLNEMWCEKIITISTDMASLYINKYKILPERLVMLPNSTKKTNVDIELKSKKHTTIVYSGGSNKNKGFIHILSLLKAANSSSGMEKVTFEMYGVFNKKDMVKLRQFDNLNIDILGPVSRSDLLNSFKRAHILLFPSYSEGCPITILEAMSYGVVTIAANGFGGMKDLVKNGENGFIFNFSDWELAALDVIKDLGANSAVRKAMMGNSVKLHQDNFSQDAYYSKLLQVNVCPVKGKNSKAMIYKWHRSVSKKSGNASLLDRVLIKLGRLKKYKELSIK